MYICLCKGISEAQVRELGLAGICSPDALAKTLGLKEEGVCGRCIRNIEALVALATSEATLVSRTDPRCDCDRRSAPPSVAASSLVRHPLVREGTFHAGERRGH
jgi:bacterioferritin-associated ferredoxin